MTSLLNPRAIGPFFMIAAWLFASAVAIAERPITAEDRTHWAFIPPTRPAVPKVDRADWIRNPIDAFVVAGLVEFGLEPAPEADRTTLLRRLSLDLIGLPPTPEEIERFLRDDSMGAYERQVDRLLASPGYGERQAQHWLDLARYADTDGFEFDQARPNLWRYRDWVVDAFNSDMPFDSFVRLQLAGDEVLPGDPGAMVATGFNRCYPDMVDLNDQGERRQHAMDDITETAGLVFLGLTVGCARCHDHKFDPIAQADFYRLQAFFTPAVFRDDAPIAPDHEQAEHEHRRREWSEELARVEDVLETAGDSERESLVRERDRLKASEPAPMPMARVLDESTTEAPPTFLRVRGEYGTIGPEVVPRFPAVLLPEGREPLPRIEPMPGSTGRRSALADWLTEPDHPLTARVIVNRLWQQHHGRGIVATPSDFGTIGDPPSHPELLDWLAVELVDRGWSLASIHRLIVTSATYRQSSRFDARADAMDPDNLLLWRHRRRRLDGEAIRDAILSASGQLNRRLGGPCIFPELPEELTHLSSKGDVWPVSEDPSDRHRRSLYVFTRRNLRFPFFEAFDRPDTNASCPVRASTTIAPQALSLLNGRLPNDAARALAARIADEAGPDRDDRIDLAYRLTLGRSPDDQERGLARAYLDRAGQGAWSRFALALLNVNEFVYVD